MEMRDTYAMEMRDTLYQVWPGLPRNQLEDLLVDYFINGLYNPETSAKLRIEGPITLTKAIDIAQIPDTGAAISVISEEVARILSVEIKPYDKSRIKAVTADGKEVRDILGFAEVDVTLGDQTLEKVRMLVFKNSTNPCLIGRDVLAVHPVTKANFEALMSNETPSQQTSKDLEDELREYLKTGKVNKCKTKHCDKSSEDDGDEMDDLMHDNANVKGCWSKNKTKIDNESINTKVPINMDRKMCESKINNSVKKGEHIPQ